MKAVNFVVIVLCFLITGCAKKPDYSLFERNKPRVVLIIPPINNTATVDAPEKFLSTVTEPVAEMGYYVIPVAVADRMLKENGVISPVEMRQVSRDKLREIFGADALLDITIEGWGTSYLVVTSTTTVKLRYRLLDLHTGQELWSYEDALFSYSGSSGRNAVGVLVGSLAHAIKATATDEEIELSAYLNNRVLMNNSRGLLKGPRWTEK